MRQDVSTSVHSRIPHLVSIDSEKMDTCHPQCTLSSMTVAVFTSSCILLGYRTYFPPQAVVGTSSTYLRVTPASLSSLFYTRQRFSFRLVLRTTITWKRINAMLFIRVQHLASREIFFAFHFSTYLVYADSKLIHLQFFCFNTLSNGGRNHLWNA